MGEKEDRRNMSNNTAFEKLFEPFEFAGLKLKNRFVMAPLSTGFASAEGFVTPMFMDYWEERARGGAQRTRRARRSAVRA